MAKKSEKKQQLIHVTALLLNRKGYTATSIADIMNASGLKKGGIYFHFPSKDVLCHHAYEYLIKKLLIPIKKAAESADSPKNALIAAVSAHEKAYESDLFADGCPLLNVGTEILTMPEDLQKLIRDSLFTLQKIIADIIVTAQTNGIFNKEIDGLNFAANYIALIEGGNLLTKIYKKEQYRITAFRQLYENIQRRF